MKLTILTQKCSIPNGFWIRKGYWLKMTLQSSSLDLGGERAQVSHGIFQADSEYVAHAEGMYY